RIEDLDIGVHDRGDSLWVDRRGTGCTEPQKEHRQCGHLQCYAKQSAAMRHDIEHLRPPLLGRVQPAPAAHPTAPPGAVNAAAVVEPSPAQIVPLAGFPYAWSVAERWDCRNVGGAKHLFLLSPGSAGGPGSASHLTSLR